MIILTETPPRNTDLDSLYRQLPEEGMVFSSLMRGESYEPSSSYDDDWSCPAVAWSSGGREIYRFLGGDVFDLQNTGALTIAAGDRYSYKAGDARFLSNMIVFPRSVTERDECKGVALDTRLIRPDPETEALMRSVSQHCRAGSREECWFHDKLIALYCHLTRTQEEIDGASRRVRARKATTQAILTARADRAQQYILKEYHDPELSIARIAQEACLSPYHLIRTFKAVTGQAPAQYLQATRMTAALRLLQESDLPVVEIAERVGYLDRTAFSRRFRRCYGMAPSAVRRV